MADYDISKAFETIENELIDSMMRNFKHHRAEEEKEGYNWSQWQSEQLKSLEQYRRTNQKKYGKQFSTLNKKIEEMLKTAMADGNAKQEAEILKAIKKGFKVGKVGPSATGEFFKVNDRKLDALINATKSDMKKAETAILRMSNDKYRKAIFNAQVYANSGAGTYEKAVDMAVKDMLQAGLNCVEYRNGARHTLSDYADMAIRTANKRAYLYGEGQKRQEWGISLVVVNSRQGGCPDCAQYIGRVFIDDVYSGGSKADGNYPLLSEAIAGGLFHPRCKDSTSTYYEGITSLEPVSSEELAQMEERETLETRQQNAERIEKRYNRLAQHSLDEDNKIKYQNRADGWHTSNMFYEDKLEQFINSADKQKFYKPIYDGDNIETFNRKVNNSNIVINAHKTTAYNNIYISDNVKLKRKHLHILDKNITKVLEMLNESNSLNKPKILIVSPKEMMTNAIASYRPVENILNINSVYFTNTNLSVLQKDFVCPDNPLSTILHELIHWQDAEKYRSKFGEITDFNKYCDYLDNIYLKKVARLYAKGYNVSDISNYAKIKLLNKEFDEVYTEYRVKKYLER